MGGDVLPIPFHRLLEVFHIERLGAGQDHARTDADPFVIGTEEDEVNVALPESLLQGPDVGRHKKSFFKAIDHIGQKDSVFFEETLQGKGKFFRREMIGNGKVVERIAEDEIVGPRFPAVHDKPSAVFVEGADPGLFRDAEISMGDFCDLRIDLHHVNLGMGIPRLHEAGKRVAASAKEEGLEGVSSSGLPSDHLFVDADILVFEMERVIQVRVGMDKMIENEGFQGIPVVAPIAFFQFNRVVVALLEEIGLFVERHLEGVAIIGSDHDSQRNDDEKENRQRLLFQEESAEDQGRKDEDDADSKKDGPCPHPGDQEKTGSKGPQDRPEG